MSIRDDIAEITALTSVRNPDHDDMPVGERWPKSYEAADAIIVLLREALLNDDVVHRHAAPGYDIGYLDHPTKAGAHVAGIRNAITAALDAIGAGGQDTSPAPPVQAQYYVGYDDADVISDMYHNGDALAYATRDDAEAAIARSGARPDLKAMLKVYRVVIERVNGGDHA